MMQKRDVGMEWKLCFASNSSCKGIELYTVDQALHSGFPCIDASVPGSFEIDLMRVGIEKDLYYSDNVLNAQRWETTHVWYFCRFDAEKDQYLHFGGIDTVVDIFLNGQLARHAENMFMEYDLEAPLRAGENELVVHLYPAVLEARKIPLSAVCDAQPYGLEALPIRKAPSMYGWDIMPRIVSCGLWGGVELRRRAENSIDEVFLYTLQLDAAAARAELILDAGLTLSDDEIRNYSFCLELTDETGTRTFGDRLYHNHISFRFQLENCRFWWPKNAGEPHLYQARLKLFHSGAACAESSFETGIRTVALERTDSCDETGSGEFVFRVNGKKIFILGTNWVPLDAFPARAESRLPQALQLLEETGCNAVRCWGGGNYGSESLYDFCDRHGILVWQDFAMACGVYPQDERFCSLLRAEAEQIVRRLRNHPSLALWAGDNECDMTYAFWNRLMRDPSHNILTRRVLPEVLDVNDFTRPYLPSSPYLSAEALKEGRALPEDHLWGPRDYFKGPYYTQSRAHFASETGYHGCPSPKSLRRFIAPDRLWPILDKDGQGTRDYLVHAACMEPAAGRPYSYRIPLMAAQVQTLFGEPGRDLEQFARMSQISQAEAVKFFIERFRMGKWSRTGIIWWNLLDGWPQISDAVVDYYYVKKLAFHFICRSQRPVCLMMSEPDENGLYRVVGVNDLPLPEPLEYEVWNITENKKLLSAKAVLPPDSAQELQSLNAAEHRFFQLRWRCGSQSGTNHYYTGLKNISYDDYLRDLAACGYDEFEGF